MTTFIVSAGVTLLLIAVMMMILSIAEDLIVQWEFMSPRERWGNVALILGAIAFATIVVERAVGAR